METGIILATGDIHTHCLALVSAKDSTCTESGNKAYYTFSCGKWLEDETGTVKITDKSNVVIQAKGHTASGWKSDADYFKTLTAGIHSLTVLLSDGECSTNFETVGTMNR